MKIIFATGNQRKLNEARFACEKYKIEVEQAQLEIAEIQHHDPIKISEHKAHEAFQRVQKPLVINDTSWKVPSLNGFPGGYMKDIAEWFTEDDFLALMSNKEDRRLCCVETVIYKDEAIEKVFHKNFWGQFSPQARGSGNSIERLFLYKGKTIGEYRDKGSFVFDADEAVWTEFSKWYKANYRRLVRKNRD